MGLDKVVNTGYTIMLCSLAVDSCPAIAVELWGLNDQAAAPSSFAGLHAGSEQVCLGHFASLAPAKAALSRCHREDTLVNAAATFHVLTSKSPVCSAVL